MTRIIEHLSDIAAPYDAMFVDLWGCVHDGVKALPEAVAALQAYRKSGGLVVLVTNSPQPRAGVETQLERFGVPHDAWDTIATSGDSARAAMFRGVVGSRVWFMGEERRDAGFFEPMALIVDPVQIERVALEEAEGIVCCGPFDPMADPADNRAQFLWAKQKGLKLLCANPDLVVDRGEVREYCAGALAQLYTEMGGESLYFGKPHPPIYDLARRCLTELGRDVSDSRILAIGDGIGTDIAGAMGEDLDSLFITGGLARTQTQTQTSSQPQPQPQPQPEALERFLTEQQSAPTFATGYLR